MAGRSLVIGFVMDPIESIDIRADTSFVLMLEAQRKGHEVLYIEPDHLDVSGGRARALATPVTLRRELGNHFESGTRRSVVLDDDVDVVFQRLDPPVDARYILVTQILQTARKCWTLNRPQSVLAHNEKLFALHFADLMPETIVTRELAELRNFMAAQGGEMIVKPLDGKGGEGIFHLVEGERNLSAILESATEFESRLVMAQQYLPAIRQGDKRILLLEGEFLGALLRVPAKAEVRANLHVGGTPEKAELTTADQRIIERVGPILAEEGLFFVGIDVIGDRLTEINVTSPTGIQEINTLESTSLEARVIERVEERVSERAARS